MNAKLFSEAMSEVNDKYYEEAANYHYKKHGWVKWIAMAACLTLVLFAALSVLPDYFRQQGTTPTLLMVIQRPQLLHRRTIRMELLSKILLTLPMMRHRPQHLKFISVWKIFSSMK